MKKTVEISEDACLSNDPPYCQSVYFSQLSADLVIPNEKEMDRKANKQKKKNDRIKTRSPVPGD